MSSKEGDGNGEHIQRRHPVRVSRQICSRESSERERPTELLETLYISERFEAGDDLKAARENHDHAVWNGVPASEIDRRLAALGDFMKDLARNRAAMWGPN